MSMVFLRPANAVHGPSGAIVEELDRKQWHTLRSWLLPERPGPLIGLHTLATGVGNWWVDRWPDPRFAVVFAGGSMSLCGDPGALRQDELEAIVTRLSADWEHVFIEATRGFEAPVRHALANAFRWDRIIFEARSPRAAEVGIDVEGGTVRRITAADTGALARLGEDVQWISDSLAGPISLARSETAWGAFVGDRLASVAVPFFVGELYEDVGVVTEEDFRGKGYSPACANAVCADIGRRGRIPSWSTSPENAASRRVAEKLGFVKHRDDFLFVVGEPLPGVS